MTRRELERSGITPHVAMSRGRVKTAAGQARSGFVGRARIEMDAMVVGAAYNLLRMTRLVA